MTNANEAAYPFEETLRRPDRKLCEGDQIQREGLTKREYFAGLAMQGLLAGFVERSLANEEADCSISVADDAVLMADALIEALNTEEKHDDG